MWVYVVPAGLAACLGLLYVYQHKLMYFPDVPMGQRTTLLDPAAEFGLPAPESVRLPMRDGVRVHLWLFVHAGSARTRATVVFFHGNAGNMSFRGDNFRGLFRAGFNVLAVEYRGFGLSEGQPGEAALRADADEVLDWLADRADAIDPTRIFVLGRSIGGAVALHLAQSRQGRLAGIIVENTFTTVDELIDLLLPKLSYFKFLLTNPWRNIDTLPDLRLPCLFISSGRDELIPPAMMKRLHDAYVGEPKEWLFLPDAQHMNAHTFSEYLPAIRNFAQRAMAHEGAERNRADTELVK